MFIFHRQPFNNTALSKATFCLSLSQSALFRFALRLRFLYQIRGTESRWRNIFRGTALDESRITDSLFDHTVSSKQFVNTANTGQNHQPLKWFIGYSPWYFPPKFLKWLNIHQFSLPFELVYPAGWWKQSGWQKNQSPRHAICQGLNFKTHFPDSADQFPATRTSNKRFTTHITSPEIAIVKGH